MSWVSGCSGVASMCSRNISVYETKNAWDQLGWGANSCSTIAPTVTTRTNEITGRASTRDAHMAYRSSARSRRSGRIPRDMGGVYAYARRRGPGAHHRAPGDGLRRQPPRDVPPAGARPPGRAPGRRGLPRRVLARLARDLAAARVVLVRTPARG